MSSRIPWSYRLQTIVQELRRRHPSVPMIVFARGAGSKHGHVAAETGAQAVGVEQSMELGAVLETVPAGCAVQGNLDPVSLLAGGEELAARVETVLRGVPDAAARLQSRAWHQAYDGPGPCGASDRGRARFRCPAMINLYLWFKAFHIIAMVAWMAGLFYLPRLFVYHADAAPGSAVSETFKVMERRLASAIMAPAAIATWVLGIGPRPYYRSVQRAAGLVSGQDGGGARAERVPRRAVCSTRRPSQPTGGSSHRGTTA